MRHPSPPFRTFLSFVLIGLLLTQVPVTAAPARVFAEESDAASSDSTGTTTENCIDSIQESVQENTDAFIEFLTEHFQNEGQNSELLDIAVTKYRAYRDVMNSMFSTYAVQITEEDFSAQADIVFSCQELIDSKLREAKDALIAHNESVASAKKTIALVEAYKSLNAQLRDLNLSVGALSGLFEKLNNSVTCYPKGCVK